MWKSVPAPCIRKRFSSARARTVQGRVCRTIAPPADGRTEKSQSSREASSDAGHPETASGRIQNIYLNRSRRWGINLKDHDIKFEEDNWEAPTLGAWGVGWQVMLDGQEITQFTVLPAGRRAGLFPISGEITTDSNASACSSMTSTTSMTFLEQRSDLPRSASPRLSTNFQSTTLNRQTRRCTSACSATGRRSRSV
jgi:hypothetical protein